MEPDPKIASANPAPLLMLNRATTALLLVDIQNDFFEEGALPVPKASEIIPGISRLLSLPFSHIIATKDWHPSEHLSFAVNHREKTPGETVELLGKSQMLWPRHCVQEETGSDFAPGWPSEKVQHIIYKGEDREKDSYSAFFDNWGENELPLHNLLKRLGVDTLVVAGLATDWCVLATVLDALRLGYRTLVVKEACRGVDLKEGDCLKAFEVMKQEGAELLERLPDGCLHA